MATLPAHLVSDKAILPRAEFERLDEVSALGIMQLAEQGNVFAWLAEEEDLYAVTDLKVCCR